MQSLGTIAGRQGIGAAGADFIAIPAGDGAIAGTDQVLSTSSNCTILPIVPDFVGEATADGSAGAARAHSVEDPTRDRGMSGAAFHRVVLTAGNDGSVEGSYGTDASASERPEDIDTLSCDLPQDLSGTCGPPGP